MTDAGTEPATAPPVSKPLPVHVEAQSEPPKTDQVRVGFCPCSTERGVETSETEVHEPEPIPAPFSNPEGAPLPGPPVPPPVGPPVGVVG